MKTPTRRTYPLGSTDIGITPIGLDCRQFSMGRGFVGGDWGTASAEEVRSIVRLSLEGGINWFDTAEAYGLRNSERAPSSALGGVAVAPGNVVIATKWFPAFRMADLLDAGKIRAAGVSNFTAGRMRAADESLCRRGYRLASNQVRYNLVARGIERNGVLDAARELGVTIIAYSPLAQGLLTGKFHDDPSLVRSRPGPRRLFPSFRRKNLRATRALIDRLGAVADAHSATAAQVALAALVQRYGETVVAVPGATTSSHAVQNAAARNLELSKVELESIWTRSDEVM